MSYHPPLRGSRPTIRLALAALATLVGGITISVSAQSPAAGMSAPVAVMQELARAFDGLEKALAAKDAAVLADRAVAIERASRVDGLWRTQRSGAEGAELDRLLRRLRRMADAVPAKVDASGWADAAGAVEDVRRACVRCHVQARERGALRNYFPARLNTVAGQVELARQGGGLRDDRSGVAIFLEGGAVQAAPAQRRTRIAVSQRGRQFTPRLVPLVEGQAVQFPNDDTVFHNVFSRSTARTFDLGLYAQGHYRSVQFMRTGLVTVYCNIHPDMVLSVLVLGNGHFDVTEEDGRFVLPNVPDGTYVLRAWHALGSSQQSITVSEGAVQQAPVRVTETRKVIEHLNKFGEPYTRKY